MKYLKLLPALIVLLNFACSKDDAPPVIPDTEKPVITVVSPTDLTNPLRATVTVKAEATDNTGIAKVEVFVDGTSIASATSSPVEASWDTKTVSDGSHIIKIVAEDTDGNKEEQSLTVNVRNVLFQFTIGANSLAENTVGWIFISDKMGKPLELKEMINGESITFDTPEGFTLEDKYTFTRFQSNYFDFGSSTRTGFYMDTYVSTTPSDFIIKNLIESNSMTPGSHTVLLKNAPIGLRTGIVGIGAQKGNYQGSAPTGTQPIVADLTKSPADIIYYTLVSSDESAGMNNAPLYYRNPTALAGVEEEVDFASFLPMDHITIDLPDATQSSYTLSYLPTAGEDKIIYGLGQTNSVTPTELKVYIPDIVFPEYVIRTSYQSPEGDFSYLKASIQPSNEFKKLNGLVSSFDYSDKKLTVEASGDYKYFSTTHFQVEYVATTTYVYSWLLYVPQMEKAEVPLPEIPAEILAKFPELVSHEFDFESVTLTNQSGIADYNDFVKVRFSNQSFYSTIKETMEKTQYFPSSGGRRRVGTGSMSQEQRIFDINSKLDNELFN